jgi:hypothetical protein
LVEVGLGGDWGQSSKKQGLGTCVKIKKNAIFTLFFNLKIIILQLLN